jgi:hypothetical protein
MKARAVILLTQIDSIALFVWIALTQNNARVMSLMLTVAESNYGAESTFYIAMPDTLPLTGKPQAIRGSVPYCYSRALYMRL